MRAAGHGRKVILGPTAPDYGLWRLLGAVDEIHMEGPGCTAWTRALSIAGRGPA